MPSDSSARSRWPLVVTCLAAPVAALVLVGAGTKPARAQPRGAQPGAQQAAATQPAPPQLAPGEIIIRPTGKRRVVSVEPQKPTRDADGTEYTDSSVRLPLGYRRDEIVAGYHDATLFLPLRDENCGGYGYSYGHGYGRYLAGIYDPCFSYGYGGRRGYGYGYRYGYGHHNGHGHNGYGHPSVGHGPLIGHGSGHVPGYGYGSGYGFHRSSGGSGSGAVWTPSGSRSSGGGGASSGGGSRGGSFSRSGR